MVGFVGVGVCVGVGVLCVVLGGLGGLGVLLFVVLWVGWGGVFGGWACLVGFVCGGFSWVLVCWLCFCRYDSMVKKLSSSVGI